MFIVWYFKIESGSKYSSIVGKNKFVCHLSEEKMTKAKVRECWQCKTIFLKNDGCNKVSTGIWFEVCYVFV